MKTLAALLMMSLVAVAGVAAETAHVKVTVPKANVRSEPSEKAPILQQVTPDDVIELREELDGWFKVLLPPNPALGGARVEAYISKKVAKIVPAQSARIATAGSTRAARAAGSQLAMSAAASSTTTTPANVVGSVDLTP